MFAALVQNEEIVASIPKRWAYVKSMIISQRLPARAPHENRRIYAFGSGSPSTRLRHVAKLDC